LGDQLQDTWLEDQQTTKNHRQLGRFNDQEAAARWPVSTPRSSSANESNSKDRSGNGWWGWK